MYLENLSEYVVSWYSCKHVHKRAATSIVGRCKVNPLPSPTQLGSAGEIYIFQSHSIVSLCVAMCCYELKTVHVCAERPQ